jgi:uncharacterized SAM-binding protein YcdF (DUF218 family)
MLWKKFKVVSFLVVAIIVLLSSFITLRLAITYAQVPTPQAIFILDGDVQRVHFAALFATAHPDLEIWISGECSTSSEYHLIFQKADIAESRIRYDLRATDTVTNFTTLVNDFVAQKIWHVYLITSDYHMTRSRAIATLIFGSRGIAVTPVTVASVDKPPESMARIGRDVLRSLIWMITGRTGASLNPRLDTQESSRCVE